ncbi:MAG TPA: DUF429 domain-containing protein [Armatimonadota bacterium]|nr:DUF429 domain-containing protein [Armatimonadota bacterium]
MNTLIIGIDCAVQPENVGLACGTMNGSVVTLTPAQPCTRTTCVAGQIADWIAPAERVLLALDAPLGWPRPLARALPSHAAGQAMHPSANELFRRETDRHVRNTYKKQSLDVGADRIARTAYAALELLDKLRTKTREAIPLAWEHDFTERVAAIEVYPAATLVAHGWEHKGYRPALAVLKRKLLIDCAFDTANLGDAAASMVKSTHVCDAGLCVLAGADFLLGEAVGPQDKELANKEGWIWVLRR